MPARAKHIVHPWESYDPSLPEHRALPQLSEALNNYFSTPSEQFDFYDLLRSTVQSQFREQGDSDRYIKVAASTLRLMPPSTQAAVLSKTLEKFFLRNKSTRGTSLRSARTPEGTLVFSPEVLAEHKKTLHNVWRYLHKNVVQLPEEY